MPGAVSLFAQAYQKQLAEKGKGGGKVGQDAISQLYADMKKGLVKGDILTYAGAEASARATPGLKAASTASQAEQARAQNELNNQAIIASNAGIEEGFARIFRTLAVGLSESGGLTSTLAGWFNEATKSAEKLALFPQSFVRALDGRDSLVADWLGAGQTKELREDWSEIKISLESILGMKTPEWFNPLKEIAQELKDLIGVAGGISKRYRETSSVVGQLYDEKGVFSAGMYAANSAGQQIRTSVGGGMNKILDVLPGGRNIPFTDIANPLTYIPRKIAAAMAEPGTDLYAKYYMQRDQELGLNLGKYDASSTESWRNFNLLGNRELASSVFGPNSFGPSPGSAADIRSSSDAFLQGVTQEKSQPVQMPTTNNNVFNMEFHMSGDTDSMEAWFKNSLTKEIEKVMPNLPEK